MAQSANPMRIDNCGYPDIPAIVAQHHRAVRGQSDGSSTQEQTQQHSFTGSNVPHTLAPKQRILAIEDEPWDTDLLVDIFGEEYEVLTATAGIEGLDLASITMPDVILLDVMMPGINGYEVCRRLKAEHRTRDIPVIFITGLGDQSAEMTGLELGAVDYITKPINPAPVRARVNTQAKLKLAQNKLALLATTDGLTGLANRRRFDEMLAYEYSRHARSGTQLSLVLLDIDYFKNFNDNYGHVSGDDCLRQVARAIESVVVRATDFVARYGGEEFVLLLPETPLQGAVVLAEKVRKCISDLAIPHNYSETADHVTASLGVVSGGSIPGVSILDIVVQADERLYAAKAAGRNQVVSQLI